MLRHLSRSLLRSFSLPAHDKSVVELAAFSEKLLAQWGSRFAGPISILRNWTFCLFYVMAELWGSVVVSLLFWGFANQVRNRPHCLPAFIVQTRRHASANTKCIIRGWACLTIVMTHADHNCG